LIEKNRFFAVKGPGFSLVENEPDHFQASVMQNIWCIASSVACPSPRATSVRREGQATDDAFSGSFDSPGRKQTGQVRLIWRIYPVIFRIKRTCPVYFAHGTSRAEKRNIHRRSNILMKKCPCNACNAGIPGVARVCSISTMI
jgi:hypothetical protein